jgi:hypothetical protein
VPPGSFWFALDEDLPLDIEALDDIVQEMSRMKKVGKMGKEYEVGHGEGGVFNHGKNKGKVRRGLQGLRSQEDASQSDVNNDLKNIMCGEVDRRMKHRQTGIAICSEKASLAARYSSKLT